MNDLLAQVQFLPYILEALSPSVIATNVDSMYFKSVCVCVCVSDSVLLEPGDLKMATPELLLPLTFFSQ